MKLLFKTVNGTTVAHTDFKKFYNGVNRSLEFDEIEASLKNATNFFIIPFIGQPLYNILSDYYNDVETDNEEKNNLIEYLKSAIANYTVNLALYENIAILASNGVRTNTDEKSQNTPQWAFKNKAWKALLNGDKYVDIALTYIQENQSSFTEWIPKEGGTKLFPTNNILEQYLNVSGFRAFATLSKYLRKATEDSLLPVIGSNLYNSMTNTELVNLCRKYVAETAFLKAIPNITLITDSDGLRVVSQTDTFDSRESLKNAQHLEMIKILMATTENNAAQYRLQLMEFLWLNKDTLTDWQTSNYYLTVVATQTDTAIVKANDYGAVSIG
jgi:hypothetical protein